MADAIWLETPNLEFIDNVAFAALSPDLFALYVAYRDALTQQGQTEQRIVSTLSVFIGDLSEGRVSTQLH